MAPKKSTGTPTRQSARTITPPKIFSPITNIVQRLRPRGRRVVRSVSAPIPADRMTSPVAMSEHALTDASSMSTTPSVITPTEAVTPSIITPAEAGSPVDINFETFNIETSTDELPHSAPETPAPAEQQVYPLLDEIFLGYVDCSAQFTADDYDSIGQYSPDSIDNGNDSIAQYSVGAPAGTANDLTYLDDAFDEFSVEGQARMALDSNPDNFPEAPVRISAPAFG